jgi:hypothetical protein
LSYSFKNFSLELNFIFKICIFVLVEEGFETM